MNKCWPELDEDNCPCNGSGWAVVNDEYQTCFIHFMGQLHPDTKSLLLDDSSLEEEARRSKLKWEVSKLEELISALQYKLKNAQADLNRCQLELVNRTPTIKMAAVTESSADINLPSDNGEHPLYEEKK